jgi:hypothetical protein
MTAITPNAARQPSCWPSQVPSGTPSTGASDAPIDILATVRPRCDGRNIAVAVDATIDQNSACVNATTSRAPSSIAYPCATADIAVAAADTPRVAPSRSRRGSLRVSAAIGTDSSTTTAAYPVSSSPTSARLRCRSSAIKVNRPIGITSTVTNVNVATDNAARAALARRSTPPTLRRV